MRKQHFFTFLLAVLLILSSCGKQVAPLSSDSGKSSSPITSSQEEVASVEAEASSEAEKVLTSSRPAKVSSSTVTSSAAGGKNNVSAPQTVAEEQKKPVSSPEIKPPETPITSVKTTHTPIAASSYYGYTLLSTAEKTLYDRLKAAAQTTTNLLDLSGGNYSVEDVQKVLSYFIADYPQYFWVYKYEFSYVVSNGKVTQLILFYTDGETIDTYDNGKWQLVDREKLALQRNTFNKQISDILKSIPAGDSAFEKEKKIHDFILNHLTYDNDLSASIDTNNVTGRLCHPSFTAYGALINGKAVCEGYAKLFQYLCCEVGIPCIQVIGTSNRQNHMWNIVKIAGDWYHIDVTWDDTIYQSLDGLLFYHYFNLTDKQITEDHTIGISNSSEVTYQPPVCTATEYNYREHYYIQLSETGQLSENASQLLSAAVSAKEKYLTICLQGTDSQLNRHLNNAVNELNRTLQQAKSNAFLSELQLSGDRQYCFVRIGYK